MFNFNNNNDKENSFFLSVEHTFLEQYENNEFMQIVINDLQQFFSSATYICHDKKGKCFEKVGFEAFLKRHLEFQSLEKVQLDFVLMGQLLVFSNNEKIVNGQKIENFLITILILKFLYVKTFILNLLEFQITL